MTVKKKIIIRGDKVQEVGYRVFLLNSALTFGIGKFYASNTNINEKPAVLIHVGAEKDIINDFYNYISENIPEDASVSNIEMQEFKGNIIDSDTYLHLIQIEQLNKGIPAIIDIRDNTGKMLEKQDKTLEKQDITIQILTNVNQNLSSVKDDTLDMRSTLTRIETDIKDTKFSLSAFIEERYRKMEGEIAEIKATLAKIQEA
ncbi:MAG: acylphosphatase (plasmid) [Candidatus Methanoperedens sp.]|nr:MAG: acylphosphatase [Candidatus Methanoperedens sp.]